MKVQANSIISRLREKHVALSEVIAQLDDGIMVSCRILNLEGKLEIWGCYRKSSCHVDSMLALRETLLQEVRGRQPPERQ